MKAKLRKKLEELERKLRNDGQSHSNHDAFLEAADTLKEILQGKQKGNTDQHIYPELQCAKCGAVFVGRPDKDYSAGVLCPEEQAARASGSKGLIGVCHLTGEFHTRAEWTGAKDG